jgi:TonB family protein
MFLFRKWDYMNLFRFGVIVLCSAIVVPAANAQSTQKNAEEQGNLPSADPAGSYPDTADGLHVLLQQLLSAIQKNDAAQVSAVTHGFILPAYQTWFPKIFGTEAGARMTQRYEGLLPESDAKFKQQMQLYIKEGMTEITVTRLESADQPSTDSYAIRTMRAMQNPVPVYSVAMGKAGATSWNVPGIFVFEQGSFGFVDLQTIHALDNSNARTPASSGTSDDLRSGVPSRIRVAGNVQAARMVRQVMPAYPSDAKSKHIQGTVVLHAVVGKDGTIVILNVVTGPAELTKSAIDAVKQWRYSPTLLNGSPIEVDTTISVIYTLDRK